jgi:hypothetical protein
MNGKLFVYMIMIFYGIQIVCFPSNCLAQNKQVLFLSKYLDKNGNPFKQVNGFAHDKQNNLYLATSRGLYKIVGNHSVFIDLQKFDSTISLNVSKVYSDRHGRIWFANYPMGWGYYNPSTGKVVNFSNSCNLKLAYIFSVFHDSKGRYWLSSDDNADTARCGLYRFNPITKTLKQFKFELPTNKHHIEITDKVTHITEDTKGKLWMGTWNGIVCFDPEKEDFETHHLKANIPNFCLFTKVHFANDSILLAGNWGRGIFMFNIHTKKAMFYMPHKVKRYIGTHNIVLDFLPLDANCYLVSTLDYGLYIFNLSTRTFTRPTNQLNETNSIYKTGVIDLHPLTDGNIAVSLTDNGFYLIDKKSFNYTYYFLPIENQISHSINQVNENAKDKTYLATSIYGSNFFFIDQKANQVYSLNPFKRHTNYWFSYLLSNGLYYISSNSGGFLFEPKTKKVVVNQNKLHPVLKWGPSNFFIPTNEKILWVYDRNVLYKFNKDLQLTYSFDLAKRLPGKDYIYSCAFYIHNDRYFFLSNRQGKIVCLDLQSNKKWTGQEDRFFCFNDLYFEENGRIWISEYENFRRLFITKKGELKLQQIPISSKAFSTKFNNILPISKNEIILTSDFGLLSFNLENQTFKDIPFPDESTGYSVDILPNHKQIYFGGNNKIIIQKHSIPIVPKTVLITEVNVNGFPLQDFISNITKSIHLDYTKTAIDFEFASTGLHNTDVVYKGIWMNDKDTFETISENGKAIYNNLRPGNYTFVAKAENLIEKWTLCSTPIVVSIDYPYWQTLWFYLLIAFITFVTLTYFYRLRIAQIRRESILKGQLLEADLKALRSQMNPHFIFNSLNSINRFIIKSDPSTASDYLVKFSKLMRLILDNSNQPFIPLYKEISTLDLYITLEQLRFSGKFNFTIIVEPEIDKELVLIQPLLLQPFVENAIWHGLMPLKDRQGQLSISFRKVGHRVNCSIIDNGIGRENAKIEKLSLHEGSKSAGIEVTIERLKRANSSATVEILDNLDANGIVCGTHVLISFDYQLL